MIYVRSKMLKADLFLIMIVILMQFDGFAEEIHGPLAPTQSESYRASEVKSSMDIGNDNVEQTALIIAKDYPGEYNLNQVSEVYDALRKGWNYYSDPSFGDKYKSANRTLIDGKISDSIGVGDCDDYAVLIASLLESLKGSTRIVFAYDRETKLNHAYAEVYLGQDGDPHVEELMSWLEYQYNQSEIPGKTIRDGEVWLNLDYNSTFPGGQYFGRNNSVTEIIWESNSRNSPKILPIIDTMDNTQGWVAFQDRNRSVISISPVLSPRGKAIQVDYNINYDGYVGISRNVSGQVLSQVRGLNLSYYGFDKQVALELRLIYYDGTIFGHSFTAKPENKWTGLEALFEDFTLLKSFTEASANDPILNLRKVEKMEILCKLDEGVLPGSGRILLDHIRGVMDVPQGSIWAEAEAKKIMVIANKLAEDSNYLLQYNVENLNSAVLLALESLMYCESPAGYKALRQSLRYLAPCTLKLYHNGEVNSVLFSSDGKMIATASRDNTARIWDSDTGEELIRMHHDDEVNSVRFSPDSRFLATASNDNTSRIWDIETGEEVKRLNHRYDVGDLIFSPKGNRIATASNEVRIWDIETGRVVFSRDTEWGVGELLYSHDGSKLAIGSGGNSGWIIDTETGREIEIGLHSGIAGAMENNDGSKISTGPQMAFSPDDRSILLALNDGTVRGYDTEQGIEIHILKLNSQVNEIEFSPNGSEVATASDDGKVRIWNTQSWELLQVLDHETQIHCIAFSPDGEMIASAIWGETARIWSTETGTELFRLNHEGVVSDLAFSNDGKRIATSGFDKCVRLWNLDIRDYTQELHQDGRIWRVVFSPDGRMVATPSWDSTAKIWDTRTGKEILRLQQNAAVDDLDFSPDCKKFATGSDDMTARIWDAATGEEIHRLDHYDESQDNPLFQMQHIKFSHNGRMVATANSDKTSRIWDVETGDEIYRLIHNGTVVDLDFSPDDKKLATSSWDGTARVWDTATGNEQFRLNHDDEVWSVAFSPDGKNIATSGSWDRTVRIWDAQTGAELRRLNCNAMIKDVIFSPDGHKIAAKLWDDANTARIWDFNTGKELYNLNHDMQLNDLAFTNDGKNLATASNLVRIWDSESGSEIQYFGQDHSISDLAISPDGRLIATASGDNVAHLWYWRQEDLIANACSRLGRKNLTEEERLKYLGNEPYKEISLCEPDENTKGDRSVFDDSNSLRIVNIKLN
jgi:WD40 repeat protein